MNKSLLSVATAVVLCTASASAVNPAEAPTLRNHAAPLAFARKAQPKGMMAAKAAEALETLRSRVAVANPDRTLDKTDETGFLNGPNNETWFFVAQYDIDSVAHEYYVERRIKGFTYTVYNADLVEVGKVHDVVRLHDGEVSVSSLSIDADVTKKFFNVDDKYEIIVGLAAATADYSVNTYSMAYSLGGATDADGNSKMLAEIPGYVVDAFDMATDRWSEKYYLTFIRETMGDPDQYDEWLDFLQTYKYRLDTYKYGGYGEPQVISTIEVPMMNLPGDGMSTPFFFSRKEGNTCRVVVQQYEKSFFVDPTGMGGNEDITPDNSLIITNYIVPDANATAFTKGAETTIKTEPNANYLCSYYGIGSLLGINDVDTSLHGTSDAPAYYVAVDNYTSLADETYTTMYYLYDAQGNRKNTVAEYVQSVVLMSDIKGQSPQIMAIQEDINGYIFKFVNLADLSEALSITSTHEGLNMTANIDRRPVGDSYEYVCEVRNGYETENGEHVARIAHIAKDGTVLPFDEFNLGQNVAYAQFYIEGAALTPYLFNTDDNNEFMILVKRYIDPATMGSATREELLVMSAGNSEPLIKALPDDDKGILANITLVTENDTKRIMIIYQDEAYRYTQEFYNLPLTKFDGGDGTAANPYRIASVADLQAVASAPKASYVVVKDFDAANYDFTPIADFAGTLDGDFHTIANLHIERPTGSAGLFVNATGAKISNLNFSDATVTLNSANLYSGLVAGSLNGTYVTTGADTPTGAVLDDVHVYGLKVDGDGYDDYFGGLVGRATLGATVSRSYVNNAEIDLPESAAAGIVGEMLTGSSVKASAFNGSINGSTEIGGIASTAAQGCVLADNHVTAQLQGSNTIGGVIGVSSRANVDRNVFQGSIKATQADRWTGKIGVGGIVGQLNAPKADDTNPDAVCVSANIVSADAFDVPAATGVEAWPGQNSTVHRIVGWTRVNAQIYVEDGETQSEAEKCLDSNYAINPFAVRDTAVGAGATTTEGVSLDKAQLDDHFLAGLGYGHGLTTDKPWITTNDMPNLYFENSIAIEASEIRAVNLAENFNIPVKVTSRVPLTEEQLLSDLVIDNDETHYQMTGNYTYDGKVLNLEMKPLKEGISVFTVSTCGSTAKTRVYTGTAGVGNVVVDNSTQPIEYYDLRGIRVDNPVPGNVLIRRQGTQITKVIIR